MATNTGDETTTDRVRVYDVTADGDLRVERLTRTENPSGTHVRVRAGICDLAALAVFDADVPSIDLRTADERMAAFGKELVA